MQGFALIRKSYWLLFGLWNHFISVLTSPLPIFAHHGPLPK